MKKITRDVLRGKPLERDCYKAYTTTNEYGKNDKRIFCYGIYGNSDDISEKCLKCPAYVMNAKPLKGENNEKQN